MSTELEISTERVQKFIDDLEAQKTILSTCTQLFTALTNHFSSLQNSLSEKSQSLDAKFQSLSSTSSQTLESLSLRESSIPDREATAAVNVESQKEAALAEFQNPKTSTQLSESLKSFCRRMDSTGLMKFIVSKRKESVSLRAEISDALSEAVDPPRLVLEAVDDFVSQKIAKTGGLTDKRWASGILVQALFPEASWKEKKDKVPEFARSTKERAVKVVENWKGQLDGDEEGVGAAEAVMFLQMVVGFELRERFEEGFLRKLIVDFASRRDMAKLAAALGFDDKMGDIIDELVKSGKEIEAIYFATEAGLTERFSPVSLLKSYVRNYKWNAANILKNGHHSAAATEESHNVELSSIRATIKCVEDHKLESEFSVNNLRKRATQLEKLKADRKRSSSASGKPQNKRGHNAGSSRGSGPSAFRPAKTAKFSNAYPPFSRRNPAHSAQHSPATLYSGPYNYGSQNAFDGPAPYGSAYGLPHSQSPAAVSQQQYSHPVDNIGTAAGYRTSGSYGG
ncbi:Frigida-like protein [Corchorus olitorius]|uniref:FRIGIDA-like protein n=1 Tax=Corchorus olitorius TaxID=93759 RepID=A0A1R3GJ46_9ROSI|nr:Frigida-like protein [Corchorus olitorius]